MNQRIKTAIRRLIRNIFLSILVLAAPLGYIAVSFTGAHTIPLDKSPFVYWSGLDPHSEVYIEWETSLASGSYVEYGTSPTSLELSYENTTSVGVHRVHLESLAADTSYYYRVAASPSMAEEQYSSIQSFHTASFDHEEFNFTVVSDTQQIFGLGYYSLVAKAIRENGDTAFVADAGDLTEEAEDQALWNQFFQESVYLDRTPLVPCPGNHDSIDSDDPKYIKYFGITANGRDVYYSFNWSNTQFIIAQIGDRSSVDPTNERNQDHFEWLNQTLQNGQACDYRILIYHINRMEIISPIIEKYNVSLAIHGHVHSYARMFYQNHTYLRLGNGATIQDGFVNEDSITQMRTNGPGFSQIFINSTGITILTYNPQHEIMDSVFLRKSITEPGLVIPEPLASLESFSSQDGGI